MSKGMSEHELTYGNNFVISDRRVAVTKFQTMVISESDEVPQIC